jgi:hypothetical protein
LRTKFFNVIFIIILQQIFIIILHPTSTLTSTAVLFLLHSFRWQFCIGENERFALYKLG